MAQILRANLNQPCRDSGIPPMSQTAKPLVLALWGPRFVKVLNRSSDAQVEEVLEIIRRKMRECLATEGRSLRLPGKEKKHDTVVD
jgi:hypothetical protein